MHIQIARGNTEGFQTFLKQNGKLLVGELFLNTETNELYCGTSTGSTLTFKNVPVPKSGLINSRLFKKLFPFYHESEKTEKSLNEDFFNPSKKYSKDYLLGSLACQQNILNCLKVWGLYRDAKKQQSFPNTTEGHLMLLSSTLEYTIESLKTDVSRYQDLNQE